MESNAARADGFYKFLVLVGLVVSVSSAGLGVWNVQRGQERTFVLETEVAALKPEAAKLQAEVSHIQSYLDEINTKVRIAPDRGTPHYNFLVDEANKTTKRVEQAQLELKGKTDVIETKSAQAGTLRTQRAQDIRLGGIIAGAGLVFTVVGLILWYWRVQRYLEIEAQARMTKHLVEEIVARSRTESLRGRDEAAEAVDETIAVVSDTRPATATN